MEDKRVVEKIVTKFFLNTCRLRPQISEPAVQATLCCAGIAALHPPDDAKAEFIPLTTGSVAEFYIEPMLPHIGDVDVMYHWSNVLAIPQGHPPPTQLPDEFHNYIKVYEITDSIPGYVYLKLCYLLTECVDDGKYYAVEYRYEERHGFSFRNKTESDTHHDTDTFNIHGPAIVIANVGSFLSADHVVCVRCLVWPPQANDWPTRHRNYGWPDSATVDRVVGNGCDVVGVAHRLCKQDEWMGKCQWRLSFSRAEIVLINSWMPVQQIVYHVLRVFMKTERLTGTLSNYHIKTLMLWACELKSIIWWTGDLCIVRICLELMHDLAVWLAEERCPHYFVNNCDLVDSLFDLETIRSQLMSTDKSWLSLWFVNSYIWKCSQLCPVSVSWLFEDAASPRELQNAVSAVVDWRSSTALYDTWQAFVYADYIIAQDVFQLPLTAVSVDCWLTELRKINADIVAYLLSVVFLHVAWRMSRSVLNDELMDILVVAVGQSIGPRRYSSRHSRVLLLSKAVSLMKAVGDRTESRSTLQLIEIELSKAYLYRALRCKNADSDSIYCLANVYLAVLYYTTGHYQTAIDHCTLVTRSQDHSQCSSYVIQGERLPNIDNDIDSALGLAVFYQYVLRTAALNQQQQTYVTAFTTELFAHYLYIKCLSVKKCQQLTDTTESQSSTCEVQSYVKYAADMQQLFIADVLLWKLVSCFYAHTFLYKLSARLYCPTKYLAYLNALDLTELLQKSAVEHLTSYRQIMARNFGSVATIITTDFEALYAYKRGDYQQCLQLSKQNVHTLLDAVDMPDVCTFPEFIQLMDDDIVSLTALTLIVYPECRDKDSYYVGITQLTLSLYLMTQCQLNLHHSVTSLAQTLHCIKVAHRKYSVEYTLDRLVLKMIAHKAITSMMNDL